MLFDTSAWIEFFIKSEKGEIVKMYLEIEECFISIVTIAEISNWVMKENLDGKELVEFVISSTKILGINPEISFLAGELNFKRKKIVKKWGVMDSFILATSLFYNLNILTKDSYFSDLENVQIL